MRPLKEAATVVSGSGLGLRRDFITDILTQLPEQVDFMEVAPENWIGIGGQHGKQFSALAEHYPITLHGLSLNIGGPDPLDTKLIDNIRQFIDRYQCPFYSEHLTACGDHGHLYDLMPLPFTEEAVHYVAERVKEVQDRLGMRIALENASYYTALQQDLSESDFICAVLKEADCDLLLDINNIYVNSVNHSYDPIQFLRRLPVERAIYFHIAGHYREAEDLRIDTHGADVLARVWFLLEEAYRLFGSQPTLLERDFNIPPLETLLLEVERVRALQSCYSDDYSLQAAL